MTAALADPAGEGVPADVGAILKLAATANQRPLNADDFIDARRHWAEEAIYDALTVTSLFNFINKWVDSTGVEPLTPDGYAARGKLLAEEGYHL